MKRKLVFSVVGLFIFSFCFTVSVFLRSYYNEKRLRNDIHKIKVGMTEEEVIEILGEPYKKQMSDIPGRYWCYKTDSTIFDIPDYEASYLLLEMDSDRKVDKVIGFKD